MAEPSTTKKLSPAEERCRLLAEIESSRRRLAGDLTEFGHAVNVRERLQEVVGRHPAWWMAGSLAAGLLLARIALPPRRVKETGTFGAAKRSLLLGLLGVAGKEILRLSEPTLKRLAQQEIERWRGKEKGS